MSLLLAWLVAYFPGTWYVYLIKVHVPIKYLITFKLFLVGPFFSKSRSFLRSGTMPKLNCFFYTTHNGSDTKYVGFPPRIKQSCNSPDTNWVSCKLAQL